MNKSDLLTYLDEAIAEKSLLKHPFYRDWQEGKLSRAVLQVYAAQYYQQVRAFPEYLQLLLHRAPAGLREIVIENLDEEENRTAPHPKLWRDFAAAVGVDQVALAYATPLPEVQALMETYRELSSEAPVAQCVAALYAYEAQVPEISTAKLEGLRAFYGVTAPEGLAYFAVHKEADKMHRAAWRGWLARDASRSADVGGMPDLEGIVTAAGRALDGLWGALDGIYGLPA
jgi:pyrroloquinoline-quinone synthase